MDKHELISGILDAFTRAVSEALSETGPEDIRARLEPASAWSPQDGAGTWTWWSGGLSTHPGANFFIGAPEETWEKLGRGGSSENTRENAFALVSRCFAKAVEEHFGDRAAAQDCGPVGRSFRRLDPQSRSRSVIPPGSGRAPVASSVRNSRTRWAAPRRLTRPAAPVRRRFPRQAGG